MKNKEVAEVLRHIAALLEIKGDNPFRVRAYQRAAQNIEALTVDVEELARAGKLERIPGIGKDLAQKIKEIISTGTCQKYEDLKREVPPELINLLSIPGVGPKTAKLLYEKLGIKSIEELERACLEHRVSRLPGIRSKTEENILRGIQLLKQHVGRRPLGEILPLAEALVEMLRRQAPVDRIDVAGSIRRRRETVKDIDILVTSRNPARIMEVFVSLPLVGEIIARGETKTSVRLKEGIQVDLRAVDPACYGAALAYFTGSKAHNIRIRELGVQRGLKINEYGIFRGDERVGGREEEEVFAAVDLPWIPPELREDRGEIEAAQAGQLPRLVNYDEIKGDFHVHSLFSDGTASVEEIGAKARQLGLKWVGICDHSQGLRVAGGLTPKDIAAKKAAIQAFNRHSKDVKLLFGTEVDILSDGRLDYPDDLLREFELVIASIHSGFRQDEATLTGRILAAIENPLVHIVGHPTGRLIGERDPYPLDLKTIFSAAQKAGVALEINAYYKRLDLNDVNTRAAKEAGVLLAIGTDAHSLEQMNFLSLGVAVARRGWCEPQNILNTFSYRQLKEWLKKKVS
ncbi:DNA polymerase/3'-5' exonuclease PolX [Thermosulfuriphilus ammonigenes]|uniref:DNA polymerase beta n=1 Tax=Thermosulfuriphilus ammonigenes TaxID=1936021 RepID=A0A6G7PUD5_9BACT|nr:DNA polymerase/3'-5' exonuclease PolX [Thermosulfuriphilus ammonigenes]MBA2848632.1 DNA polymerase (family 10) [Thermosulfuriphilus ammonigenes]QIJ71230.1 DNA polymerase/3'-5' exonuclease PolX [Thermosulfuriphilus ammonigenes]